MALRSPQKSCLSNNSFHQFSRAQPMNWFDFYVSFLHRADSIASFCRAEFFLLNRCGFDWLSLTDCRKDFLRDSTLWTLLCSAKSAWFLLPSMKVHTSALYWLSHNCNICDLPRKTAQLFYGLQCNFTAAIKFLKAKWSFMTSSNRESVRPPQICFSWLTMEKK